MPQNLKQATVTGHSVTAAAPMSFQVSDALTGTGTGTSATPSGRCHLGVLHVHATSLSNITASDAGGIDIYLSSDSAGLVPITPIEKAVSFTGHISGNEGGCAIKLDCPAIISGSVYVCVDLQATESGTFDYTLIYRQGG